MTMKKDIELLLSENDYSWNSIKALSRLSGLDLDSSGQLLSNLIDQPDGIVDWLTSENFIIGQRK